MKKIISVLIAVILCFGSMLAVSAESSVNIDFGDIAGKAGDVNVDTYISSSDLALLRKILLGVTKIQSKKTADVNADNVIDIRDMVHLKKIFSNAEKMYFSQGTTTVYGSSADKTGWIYKMNDNGLFVRESDITLGNTGKRLTITHMSDFHLVVNSAADQADAQLATSYNSRKSAFKNQIVNAQKALEFASFADKGVITGDVTDYLSEGALTELKTLIGNTSPIVTVGNHEFRKVWYGSYVDTVPEAERYAKLQENWPYNNIYYHSEVLKNKVMLIAMNNGAVEDVFQNYYPGEFTYNGVKGTMDKFLSEDLATAREKGYAVLIFQHCPISTGKEADKSVTSLDGKNTIDLYSKYVGGPDLRCSEVDNAVYKMITENGALIKGIYSGHVHGHYYSEVRAKATSASANYDTVIPQYSLTCNAYDNGSVLKITVNY